MQTLQTMADGGEAICFFLSTTFIIQKYLLFSPPQSG